MGHPPPSAIDAPIGAPLQETSEHPQITKWRAAIKAAPLPLPPDFEPLRAASLAFLDGPLIEAALAAAWSEEDLFGVHAGTHPRARLDAQGLIPMCAWSSLKFTPLAITAETAALLTAGGSTLTHHRDRPASAQAVAWWRHPSITDPGKEPPCGE